MIQTPLAMVYLCLSMVMEDLSILFMDFVNQLTQLGGTTTVAVKVTTWWRFAPQPKGSKKLAAMFTK